MSEQEIDNELDTKAVIVRDGARGRYLVDCFLEDAGALLNREIDVPAEDSEEYEFIHETANDLENDLASMGYTTVWNDGYVIYKNLSEAAQEALSDV